MAAIRQTQAITQITTLRSSNGLQIRLSQLHSFTALVLYAVCVPSMNSDVTAHMIPKKTLQEKLNAKE